MLKKRVTRKQVADMIHCEGGETVIYYSGAVIQFKYKSWVCKVNPKFLVPQARKEHRKVLKINGKRRGFAETRYGIIPRQRYQIPGKSLLTKIKNFVRNTTGWWCNRFEKGYVFLAIDREKYIILQRITDRGLRVCEVYWLRHDIEVGVVVFDPLLEDAQFTCSIRGGMTVLVIAAGYILDNAIYSLAASQLTRTVKIKV